LIVDGSLLKTLIPKKWTPFWNTVKFGMGKCKLELYFLLMFCTSGLDLNNSLFLTTSKKIYTEIGEARLPNF
jgi:hypothetical protein